MMRHQASGLLAVAAAGALLLSTGVSADCDRDALVQFADTYVAAQENGQAADLEESLAEDFTYVENNQTAEIGAGIFTKALTIDHRRTVVDTIDCATFTELVVTHDAEGAEAPYVIGSQIRHNQEDLSVYLIDSIVSTTGNWLFNATGTLYWVKQETWDPIPEEARDSREYIKAAADAYLSMWDNATAADAVP